MASLYSYFEKCLKIREGEKSDCNQSRVTGQREAIREKTLENAGDKKEKRKKMQVTECLINEQVWREWEGMGGDRVQINELILYRVENTKYSKARGRK